MMMKITMAMTLMMSMAAALPMNGQEADAQEESEHASSSQTSEPGLWKIILLFSASVEGRLILIIGIILSVKRIFLSVKRIFQEFLEVYRLICDVYEKCVAGIMYICKKIQKITSIIRRVFLHVPEHATIDENNNEYTTVPQCETSIRIEETSQNSGREEPGSQQTFEGIRYY